MGCLTVEPLRLAAQAAQQPAFQAQRGVCSAAGSGARHHQLLPGAADARAGYRDQRDRAVERGDDAGSRA